MRRIQEIVEEEEFSLEQFQDELESLRKKWIKAPWTLRTIETLEYVIIEKERFIEKLKQFKNKK